MHYSLQMLYGASSMKDIAVKLTKDMSTYALGLVNANGKTGNTQAHLDKLSKMSTKRDLCLLYYQMVVSALDKMQKPFKLLLTDVHLKKTKKEKIATANNVSLATVYRKLHLAQSKFAKALIEVGCDQQWYDKNLQPLATLYCIHRTND